MIVVRGAGYLFDHQRPYPTWELDNFQMQRYIEEFNVGGVILLGGSAAEIYLKTQKLQSYTDNPLLIAADIEEGVGQRFSGATEFPPPMALGEIYEKNPIEAKKLAYEMGKITAKEALAIGINLILAPVMDVNNNPLNPVINIRSFSSKTEVVSELGTAFIEGAKNFPILTTAKHFPGHGDTELDSHLSLPTINCNENRLNSVEIPPFKAAIKASVDSIMTAHLNISVWDKNNPATVSSKILRRKLRNQMNFSGIIVTDALIMGGVANYYNSEELALKVVEAGADILLMPENPEIAINAIEKAVINGTISEERINASLERITKAKSKLNNQLNSFEDEQISQKSARETVNLIIKKSLKKQGNISFSENKNKEKKVNLIYVNSLLNQDFLACHTPSISLPTKLGYKLKIIEEIKLATEISEPTLLQIFLRGNPFRGSAGLTSQNKKYLQIICQKSNLEGILIYGSPYIFEWFCEEIPENLPCLFSYGQFFMAQEIMMKSFFNLTEITPNNQKEFI